MTRAERGEAAQPLTAFRRQMHEVVLIPIQELRRLGRTQRVPEHTKGILVAGLGSDCQRYEPLPARDSGTLRYRVGQIATPMHRALPARPLAHAMPRMRLACAGEP